MIVVRYTLVLVSRTWCSMIPHCEKYSSSAPAVRYAASCVQYGNECWCGNSDPSAYEETLGVCHMQCAGDSTSPCGECLDDLPVERSVFVAFPSRASQLLQLSHTPCSSKLRCRLDPLEGGVGEPTSFSVVPVSTAKVTEVSRYFMHYFRYFLLSSVLLPLSATPGTLCRWIPGI